MVRIYSTRPKALLENYACVKSALIVAEQKTEKSLPTISTYMAYCYPMYVSTIMLFRNNLINQLYSAVEEMLNNSKLLFMLAKLTKAEKESLQKDSLEYIKVKGKSCEDSDVDSTRGHLIWKKYGRLKGVIMNELIPTWNRLVQSNSGRQLDEMLRLFRKRLFYEVLKDKQHNEAKATGESNEPETEHLGSEPNEPETAHLGSEPNEPETEDLGSEPNEPETEDLGNEPNEHEVEAHSSAHRKLKEYKSSFLDKVAMPDDWYPPLYLPFLIFGPPAAPEDCAVFRAQMSSGPKQKIRSKERVMSAESCLLNMDQVRSSVIASGTRGATVSRAEAKNRARHAAQEAVDSKRHADFVVARENNSLMDEYFAASETRRLCIQAFKEKIQLAVDMGDSDDVIQQLRLNYKTYLDSTPVPVAPQLTHIAAETPAKRRRTDSQLPSTL